MYKTAMKRLKTMLIISNLFVFLTLFMIMSSCFFSVKVAVFELALLCYGDGVNKGPVSFIFDTLISPSNSMKVESVSKVFVVYASTLWIVIYCEVGNDLCPPAARAL